MKKTRGFTLIEMAIVLVIITILIGGLAMPLSAQIQARRIAETKKTLEEAREAILGYAMTHSCTCAYDTVAPTGVLQPAPQTTCTSICPASNPSSTAVTFQHAYLPCPDISGDGTGDLIGPRCANSHGFLPWVVLGVANQDAWGNRLRYEVDRDLADPNKGFAKAVPTGFTAPIICQTHSCDDHVADDLAFVLVSQGPNGWGAQNINNAWNILQAAPTGPDEAENLGDDGNGHYVSRSATKADNINGEFDDLLVWYSYSLLVAKVCPTGSDCAP
jgi:prepilin-type N-terminal cleavage/methylation domain-containing protein